MARRDERRRNNRLKITETHKRQRSIDGGSTDYKVGGVYRADDTRTPDGVATFTEGGLYDSNVKGLGSQDIFAQQKSAGSDTWVRYDGTEMKGSINELGDGAYRQGKAHNFIRHEADFSIDNPDKQVTETIKSSRHQALDKVSGDDDAQKNRKLKTKREGRGKLRIQLSGDSSAGRLKGGPNSGRQRNKLKIDVQSAGGGTGINAPR